MAGVLPMNSGPAPPPRGTHGGATGQRHHPRAPLDRGVHRTTECPCAVRIYHMTSSDITARSDLCSRVLGAPSVNIAAAAAAMRLGVLPTLDGTTAAAGPSPPSTVAAADPAVEQPVAVQLAWADTTVWEVALTALQAVREQVDAAYKAGTTTQTSGGGSAAAVQRRGGNEEEEEGEEDVIRAPYSTPLSCYEVELLTGSVGPDGRASVVVLCTVGCRQVVHDHTGLLPMRRQDWVDYNTALYELPYNLGDVIFATCTRVR